MPKIMQNAVEMRDFGNKRKDEKYMLSEKCLLEAEHVGGLLAVAKSDGAMETIYMGDKDNKDVIVGMSVWIQFDMRYAELMVYYDKKEKRFMEMLSLAPFGFRHKTGENDLNADMATAYIARFEKNGEEGDIIANIPDLEKGHENPYVIALMREAFDYYTGAKHHVKKAHKNREQEDGKDGSAQIEEVKKLENNFCEIICKIGEIYGIYGKLMRKKEILFQGLEPTTIPDGLCGVYVIFDKNTGEALYVGRTTRMRDRLAEHLKGRKMAAPLKNYLIKEEELKNFFGEKMLSDKKFYEKELYEKAGEWIETNCYFKYIEIGTPNDFRERGHTEGLLGFLLDSRYIEKEH